MSFEPSTLESMCELIIDCPHSTPKWKESGVVVLRNQNIRNGQLDLSSPSFTDEAGYNSRTKRAAPQAGDIVFTREAPMGEVCVVPENLRCCLGQRQVLLRPKSNVCNSYLYWALQSPFVQHQISWNEGTGTTVSNVRIPVLKSLLIPRNGENESYIAECLNSLSKKSQLNHQINQTLEQMAQALFKSWFVDFEPVKAKIAARERWQALQPENESASPVCYAAELDEPPVVGDLESYMNRTAMQAIAGKTAAQLDALCEEDPERYQELYETAALFPSAMQASELGEIPEGWKPTAISEVAEIIKGKSYKSAELSTSKTALVTLKSFSRGGGYRLDGLKDYTGSYKASQEVVSGDLVIAYTDVTQAADVIGKPAMVIGDDSYEHLVISLDVAVVRPFNDFLKVYLYGLAKTEEFQAHTGSHTTGTTVLHLSKNAVPSYKFALPLKALIMAYKKQVSPLFSLIDNNVQEGRNLSKLRDTLLPKLLSGEISAASRGGV